MKLDEMIGGFAATVGIENVSPDDAGGYTLEIDGMAVSFLEATDGQELLTVAEVGELPDSGEKSIFRYLMESMFRDGASGGAVFSLEPGTKRIWAHRRDFLPAMDGESFRTMLERFVNGMEEWRRIVSGLSDLAPKLAEAEEKAEGSELPGDASSFLRV